MLFMDTHIPHPTAVRAPLTEAALCKWLGAAAPGDAITYFRGTLARSLCPQLSPLTPAERARVATLARRAWKLAESGSAHLVQRRHGFEDFSYIVIAPRRPRKVRPSVLPRILAEAN